MTAEQCNLLLTALVLLAPAWAALWAFPRMMRRL